MTVVAVIAGSVTELLSVTSAPLSPVAVVTTDAGHASVGGCGSATWMVAELVPCSAVSPVAEKTTVYVPTSETPGVHENVAGTGTRWFTGSVGFVAAPTGRPPEARVTSVFGRPVDGSMSESLACTLKVSVEPAAIANVAGDGLPLIDTVGGVPPGLAMTWNITSSGTVPSRPVIVTCIAYSPITVGCQVTRPAGESVKPAGAALKRPEFAVGVMEKIAGCEPLTGSVAGSWNDVVTPAGSTMIGTLDAVGDCAGSPLVSEI